MTPKARQVRTEFEQTTYFEWLNSTFASANYQSCQNCHMPDNFKGTKLAYQIANIEDSTISRWYQRSAHLQVCRWTN